MAISEQVVAAGAVGAATYFLGGRSLYDDVTGSDDQKSRFDSQSGKFGVVLGAAVGVGASEVVEAVNHAGGVERAAWTLGFGILGASLGGSLLNNNRGLETNGAVIGHSLWALPAVGVGGLVAHSIATDVASASKGFKHGSIVAGLTLAGMAIGYSGSVLGTATLAGLNDNPE